MARHRDRADGKPQLSESWVVESEGGQEYEAPSSSSSASSPTDIEIDRNVRSEPPRHIQTAQSAPRSKTPDSVGQRLRRLPRSNASASAEPELIMPPIHEDGPGRSWLGEEKPRRRKETPRKPAATALEERNHHVASQAQSSPSQIAEALKIVTSFLRPIFNWIFDVLGGSFIALKTPISFFIAIYLFLGTLVLVRNLLTNSITTALSPLCRIPGSSLIPLCRTTSTYTASDTPVQFDELMTLQSKFEDVLAASAGGVSLPLDMKRGETSIRDLRTVVRHSSLHSRNELVLEFDHFIQTARIASTDLQKFNSHVGRGVDNVLATARWTKRVLDGIAIESANQGVAASFFNDKLLAPFQPVRFTEDTLLDQYIQHTRIVEEQIERLVLEAQALLQVLTNLEDRLDVIHSIATREDIRAQTSRQEVLSELWTILGGNRNKVGKLDSQLNLLRQVNTYRQTAFAHVSGTMLKLQAMSAELEELRERVGGVELLGGKMGVPLGVHIENIEMGVERLEEGRARAKEVEGEAMRRAVEGPGWRGIGG